MAKPKRTPGFSPTELKAAAEKKARRKHSDPRLSAQIHVIAMRGPMMEFVQAMLRSVPQHKPGEPLLTPTHRPRADVASLPNVRRVPGPWTYTIRKGGVEVSFDERWVPTERMLGQLVAASGSNSNLNNVPYHEYGATKNTIARRVPREAVTLARGLQILTITSKMGAMSFNLPAGPGRLGGTCPGSVIGWRDASLPVYAGENKTAPEERVTAKSFTRTWSKVRFLTHPRMKPEAVTMRLGNKQFAGKRLAGMELTRLQSGKGKMAVLQIANMPQDKARLAKMLGAFYTRSNTLPHGEINVQEKHFICNGCYALKGQYGNANQVFTMEVRRAWVMWCLRHDPQEFIDVMSLAVRVAQTRSTNARARKWMRPPVASNIAHEHALAEPDPMYFRIHDAGDFFSAQYFQMWLSVIDRFPDVRFWAPTRLWFSPEISSKLQEWANVRPRAGGKVGLPANLALRPSALHFGDRSPSLPALTGMNGGSGASNPLLKKDAAGNVQHCTDRFVDDHGRVHLAEWQCPAYRPYTEGGGAALKTTGKGADLKARTPLEFEDAGACQYAKGLPYRGESSCNGPRVQGCRVCWEQPDINVTYAEH